MRRNSAGAAKHMARYLFRKGSHIPLDHTFARPDASGVDPAGIGPRLKWAIAASAGLKDSFLLFNDCLEARAVVHALDISGELRPSMRVELASGKLEIHEDRGDADVGDRETISYQELFVADFVLEIVEQRRDFFVEYFLYRRLVGFLIEEARPDHTL